MSRVLLVREQTLRLSFDQSKLNPDHSIEEIVEGMVINPNAYW